MGTDHRPITTQVDDHELQIEQIELAIHRLAKRLGKMEKLMGQLTTAAIAATAAFDAMKQLMEEQTGLEEGALHGDFVKRDGSHSDLYDQDADIRFDQQRGVWVDSSGMAIAYEELTLKQQRKIHDWYDPSMNQERTKTNIDNLPTQ